jgi:hypothetical protein
LRAHGASAEDVLVALVDAMVDSYVDHQLRERGLGPEPHGVTWADALNPVQAAIYYSQFEFGKGYGRQPARGSAADAAEEQQMFFTGNGSLFERKLTPVQRALRRVVLEGWGDAIRFLDRVDPPCPQPADAEADTTER